MGLDNLGKMSSQIVFIHKLKDAVAEEDRLIVVGARELGGSQAPDILIERLDLQLIEEGGLLAHLRDQLDLEQASIIIDSEVVLGGRDRMLDQPAHQLDILKRLLVDHLHLARAVLVGHAHSHRHDCPRPAVDLRPEALALLVVHA
jgi:hypothetical protein